MKTYATLPCIDRCAVHTYTHTQLLHLSYVTVCIATYAKRKTPVYLLIVHYGDSSHYKIPLLNTNSPPPLSPSPPLSLRNLFGPEFHLISDYAAMKEFQDSHPQHLLAYARSYREAAFDSQSHLYTLLL